MSLLTRSTGLGIGSTLGGWRCRSGSIGGLREGCSLGGWSFGSRLALRIFVRQTFMALWEHNLQHDLRDPHGLHDRVLDHGRDPSSDDGLRHR